MRATLSLAAILGFIATIWCAGGYFAARAQAGETRAELTVYLNRPVTAEVPEIHARRVLQQGRNEGFAALLAGASTALMITALALSFRKRSYEHAVLVDPAAD